jgi:RsiW-degrading membrane proteinase PrsW (M82 family)
MLVAYILCSLVISATWIDFFRRIDFFEKEKLRDLLLVFCGGCLSVFAVFFIHDLIGDQGDYTESYSSLFLYQVIRVGLVEEACKLLPFLIFWKLNPKALNEPLDYLIYVAVSALGFACVENILYFQNYGPDIVSGRSVLSTLGHVMFSGTAAYGFIRKNFQLKTRSPVPIFSFLGLAALMHGIFNTLASYHETPGVGLLLTVFYFLFLVNFYAEVLNNTINNSPFFDFKKQIPAWKICGLVIRWYVLIFLIQLAMLIYTGTVESGIYKILAFLLSIGFIISITSIRLSRMRLIPGKWKRFSLSFPIGMGGFIEPGYSNTYFKIDGPEFDESDLDQLIDNFFFLKPYSKKSKYLKQIRVAYMERKIFDEDERAYYVIRVFLSGTSGAFERMILIPRLKPPSFILNKYPLVFLFSQEDSGNLPEFMKNPKELILREMAIAIPRKKSFKTPGPGNPGKEEDKIHRRRDA